MSTVKVNNYHSDRSTKALRFTDLTWFDVDYYDVIVNDAWIEIRKVTECSGNEEYTCLRRLSLSNRGLVSLNIEWEPGFYEIDEEDSNEDVLIINKG